MAARRDYYEVLGVDRNASEAQISEAYRKLALRFHPDRNPGDEEAVAKFKEAAEAFEVLGHAEKRARYDRFGHAGLEGHGAPHFHDVSDIFSAFGDIFGEGLFGELFGGGRRHPGRPSQGADVRCDLTIDLSEAAHGTAKEVRFTRHAACETCGGSGATPGTRPEPCRYCGGRGRVVQSTGIFSLQTTCPSCHGSGQTIAHPCGDCRGSGFVKRKVTRKVDVPPGVDNRTRLRLQGEGEPSPNGGPPGDCYCFIHIAEHPLFQRRGQDLICEIPIGYSQAALGAMIEVPTLEGSEELHIPAGTQNGEVFSLRGHGMPDLRRRGRGNLLVQVGVEVHKPISPEHEVALRQLAKIENTHVSSKKKTFFEKIKDLFSAESNDRSNNSDKTQSNQT
ncbi:MAG: molecular chaperone DnaJ [Pirellulales bacterium]|nr:molecular chaperone DnaJ [Pirellulales bacterium]